MEIIKTERGNDKLCYEGHMYVKKISNKDSIRWVCYRSRAHNCKGAVTSSTLYENPRSFVEHNHPADKTKTEVAKVRHGIRTRARNIDVSPSEAVEECLQSAPSNVLAAIGSVENCKRYARRVRKRCRLKEPDSLQVEASSSWNQPWDQQWTLNEVTPSVEQNITSNIRTHPPETSFLLPKERRTFVVPNHLETFMSNLSSLWKAGRLCDASISNGTEDIMIHKMVLATVCPKILTELSKAPLDKFQKVTFPSSVSKEALLAFAEYMYSGVLDLDEVILVQLKIIAQRLDMKDFEHLCEGHLQTSQLIDVRMAPALSNNDLQSVTDFESNVGPMTQVTFHDDIAAPMMKMDNDAWPVSTSDNSFPISSAALSEGILKIKQEIVDPATHDDCNELPLIKKEPVTPENEVICNSSAMGGILDSICDKSLQPQGRSLPHVESLVSLPPLCTKMKNSNPAQSSLNFTPLNMPGIPMPPQETITSINLHGNSQSSSLTPSTSYSCLDNSGSNLLSSYAPQTSESEAKLTTSAAEMASLTSNSDEGTQQTPSIELPSPLSFYNIS